MLGWRDFDTTMTDTTMTDTTPWEEYCEASRDLSNQEDVGDPEEKTSDLG